MAAVKTAKFNVGGKKYEVSRSLLENFKDSMLYRSATEAWQKDPTEEIFIERNGERFQYILDYLRDGKGSIPFTVSKSALIADAEYYGIEVDNDEIIQDMGGLSAAQTGFLKKKCEFYSASRRMAEFFVRRYELNGKLILQSRKLDTAEKPEVREAWRVFTEGGDTSEQKRVLDGHLKRLGLTLKDVAWDLSYCSGFKDNDCAIELELIN